MKKTLSIALAASIALSAIAVSAAPASARNDRAALAIFGAVVGIAAIAAANQHRYDYYYGDPHYGYPPPPPRHYYGGYSPHAAWCLDRYRTYNPATNTYFRRAGVPAVCYSPY